MAYVLVPDWPSSVSVWPAATLIVCSWLTKKKSSPSAPAGAYRPAHARAVWAVHVGVLEPYTSVLPPRYVWSKLKVSPSSLPKMRVTLQSRPGLISLLQARLSVPGVITPARCMIEP